MRKTASIFRSLSLWWTLLKRTHRWSEPRRSVERACSRRGGGRPSDALGSCARVGSARNGSVPNRRMSGAVQTCLAGIRRSIPLRARADRNPLSPAPADRSDLRFVSDSYLGVVSSLRCGQRRVFWRATDRARRVSSRSSSPDALSQRVSKFNTELSESKLSSDARLARNPPLGDSVSCERGRSNPLSPP